MTPFICNDGLRLYSVITAKLYNKKEIVSIIEKYTGCIKKNWTDLKLLSISQNTYLYPGFYIYSFFGYL
jgi:hypothetical protein